MTNAKLTMWREFGSEVRRLRLQAGMNLEKLAPHAGVSPQMLGAMERGTRRTQEDVARKLDVFFATNGALMRRWSQALRGESDPEWYQQVTESEEAATEIHMYHPTLIPGLLQIEAYALVVFRDSGPLDSAEEHQRLAQLRVKRLDALIQANNPKLLAVIPEEVLRGHVGKESVMQQQRERLVRLAGSERLRLLVVPRGTPYLGGASGAFRVIGSQGGPPIVYAEHMSGGMIIDDPQDVARHQAIYRELLSWALPPIASIDLIRTMDE
ncbi:helix-turn-helix domain-containing protein [Murinocardiopsis flavida]|nr:helix-turn-helix transcriptional regulator [Murinocardiopsis flavida]